MIAGVVLSFVAESENIFKSWSHAKAANVSDDRKTSDSYISLLLVTCKIALDGAFIWDLLDVMRNAVIDHVR